MARTGRPTSYTPEEDAVLLNTEGADTDYTNAVLRHVGGKARSVDAITSRRSLLHKRDRRPAVNELERLDRVQDAAHFLEVRARMAHEEARFLTERLRARVT